MNVNQGERNMVSAKRLADMLDVSVRTIRNWQKAGRLPYTKITRGTVRFEVAEVLEALKQREVRSRN